MTARDVGVMNCDGIARFYETLERVSFGGELQRRRVAFLRQVTTARRALVCGDGDGRFLAELVRANPRMEVDYVDASARMKELAQLRVVGLGTEFSRRVRFHVQDIREFAAEENSYDLVTAHFFLDCFAQAELVQVIARVSAWATADARWMVSDFREAPSAMGRVWTRVVIRGLYGAFRVMTGLRVTRVPDYAAALEACGYSLCCEDSRLGGLVFSSLWKRDADGGTQRRTGRSLVYQEAIRVA